MRNVRLTESQFNKIVSKCVKKAIRESEELNDPIMQSLADEIGVSVEDLTETDYQPYGNCRHFEVSDGSEYITFNNIDDAYEGAVEWNRSLIEDEHCLPNLNIQDFLDESWVADLAREEADFRTDDAIEMEEITEEEGDDYWQERYNEIINDPIEYLEGMYGKDSKDLADMLLQQGALNIDSMARECVDCDGIAHALASYDGEEIALDNDAFAYRIN